MKSQYDHLRTYVYGCPPDIGRCIKLRPNKWTEYPRSLFRQQCSDRVYETMIYKRWYFDILARVLL